MNSEQNRNINLNNPRIKELSSRKSWVVVRNTQLCRVDDLNALADLKDSTSWGTYDDAKSAADNATEHIDAIACILDNGKFEVFDGSSQGYSAKPSTTASELAAELNAERQGSEYITFCPVHEVTGHHTPSLSFRDGTTQIVFWCRSRNCDTKEISRLLLGGKGRKLSSADRHLIKVSQIKYNALLLRDPDKVHEYTDNAGEIVAHKGKWIDSATGGKHFLWWHFVEGKKKYGKPKHMLPFYNLHNAVRAETVWVVEGEKDVDTLARLGQVATTASDGAGSWDKAGAYPMLENKSVIVCPDNDEAGEQYLADVLASLDRKNARVVRVPAPHKDISDYVEAGGVIESLLSADGQTSAPEEAQPEQQSDAVDAVASAMETAQPLEAGNANDDLRTLKFSDDGLALAFTKSHGENLRFTSQWGKWHTWNGHIWTPDQTMKVYDLSRRICRSEAEKLKTRSEIRAARVASSATVASVERLARSDRKHSVTVDQWDADPWLLNTPGGVLDLRTGQLRMAKRTDYMTKSTSVAPADGTCLLWRKFLDRITEGNKELETYLQRVAGYTLTGTTREQALFFCHGTGANGKSVFLNVLSGVMGDYARVAPIAMLTESRNDRHPTELAGLQGARLVTAGEIEGNCHWAEAKIKALTGGDPISARFMRQDFFEYLPQFKLLIAGNHRPGLRNVDEAVRRRLHLIPFTVTIPAEERDTELPEKLQREWPAILRWMVEGCLDYQKQGLCPPKIVTDTTDEYLRAEDALGRWIEDRCEKDRTAWSSSVGLFADWSKWAVEQGEIVGSQKLFGTKLVERGYPTERLNKSRGFRGIRLRSS